MMARPEERNISWERVCIPSVYGWLNRVLPKSASAGYKGDMLEELIILYFTLEWEFKKNYRGMPYLDQHKEWTKDTILWFIKSPRTIVVP